MANDLVTSDITDRRMLVTLWLYYYKGRVENLEDFLTNNHTAPLMKISEYAQHVNHDLLPEAFQATSEEKSSSDFGNAALGLAYEDFLLNPYANPLMALEMTALPPALVSTAEFDPARDDGFFYSQRLVDSNVTISHKHYEAGFHLFTPFVNGLVEFEVSKSAAVELVIYVKSAFKSKS